MPASETQQITAFKTLGFAARPGWVYDGLRRSIAPLNPTYELIRFLCDRRLRQQ